MTGRDTVTVNTLIVWTEGYNPWIMGGDCHAPIGTSVAVGERFDLGGGYEGYLIANPTTGETFVAEAKTGAFVGPSLASVRKDIEAAAPAVMREQIKAAADRMLKMQILPSDDFWGRFRKQSRTGDGDDNHDNAGGSSPSL
jgi:hypothetical protein